MAIGGRMKQKNEKIIQYLKDYSVSRGYAEKDFAELLTLERPIYTERVCERRHWDEYFYVAKVGNKYIGFEWAESTGDNSIWDLGWEFYPDTIVEVEPIQKLITIYNVVKE